MERSHPKPALKTKDQVKDKYSKICMNIGYTKPAAKENTKPQEFKLHTGQRAVKRAMFNYSVATKFYLLEIQKKQVEKVQKMIEDEEIRCLRKEMVPKAQLMPFFDRPFFPQSKKKMEMQIEPAFNDPERTKFPHSEF
ncbi:hypothetical protein ES332_A08G048100v1 [Gossypium tomentosum]|uniref:TPX2 C-terminal domain-containing protein n=1 Tax=Gossypium tomentosum TaxID=34277 RepID=A0A5D2PA72_GOSTO|nr:hypothetical protein ES332_A08G048100v1 [Gossypium tomentosum]